MTHGTEEKIMDAALKEFAECGYAGAKTKAIAKRSGLSEMTLFRRFKSKKNLFNRVLNENQQTMIRDFNKIFNENEIQDPEDFFETVISLIYNFTENNFDYISIIILERRDTSADIIKDFMKLFIEIIDETFPQSKIDSKVFVFNLLSFIYFIILDKRQGRNFVNHEDAIHKFINYSKLCIQVSSITSD